MSFKMRSRLTVCLSSWTVGVTERDESRLHQLGEEDILPDEYKLCMLLSSLTYIWLNPSIWLLHNTEDWNHQTCPSGKRNISGKNVDCTSWILNNSIPEILSKLQWDEDIIEASIHQLHHSLFNQWSNGRLEDIYGNVSANTYANPIQISQRPTLTVSVVITTVIEHLWVSKEKTWSLLNIVAVTAEKGSMDED